MRAVLPSFWHFLLPISNLYSAECLRHLLAISVKHIPVTLTSQCSQRPLTVSLNPQRQPCGSLQQALHHGKQPPWDPFNIHGGKLVVNTLFSFFELYDNRACFVVPWVTNGIASVVAKDTLFSTHSISLLFPHHTSSPTGSS